MNTADFVRLIDEMTGAAEAADGERFARCFTDDATYHDYVYGPHVGRPEIAHMLEQLFRRDAADDYRWEFFDPVFDGRIGYAWSLSSFTSLVPEYNGKHVVIDGMSRFTVRDGLVAEYRESANGGVAMHQLGVAPARMDGVFRRWTRWLKERPETAAYAAKGPRRGSA